MRILISFLMFGVTGSLLAAPFHHCGSLRNIGSTNATSYGSPYNIPFYTTFEFKNLSGVFSLESSMTPVVQAAFLSGRKLCIEAQTTSSFLAYPGGPEIHVFFRRSTGDHISIRVE